ncbi:MAG: hypothetical protein DRP08_07780 [Candidatus Aenigmatarchaeota archaeon]|nr:MAG: hypothetical protein DRP08_07780 [Candidatus Aenigmarchaeota archaeon]
MPNLYVKFIDTIAKHQKRLYKTDWKTSISYGETARAILDGLIEKFGEARIRKEVVDGLDVLGKNLEKLLRAPRGKPSREVCERYESMAEVLMLHPKRKTDAVKVLKTFGKYVNKLAKKNIHDAYSYALEVDRMAAFWEPKKVNANLNGIVGVVGKYANKLDGESRYRYIADFNEILQEFKETEWNPEETLALIGGYARGICAMDEKIGQKFLDRASFLVKTSRSAGVDPARAVEMVGYHTKMAILDRNACIDYIHHAPCQLFDVKTGNKGGLEKLDKYSREKLGDAIRETLLFTLQLEMSSRRDSSYLV